MRIGLIADTHITQEGRELPHQVVEAFQGVELILHAGDLIVLSVLDWLEKIAPVLAVCGNGDSGLLPDPRLPETRVLTIYGKRLGMCHVLTPLGDLPDFMEKHFNGAVDILVFGDTHVATIETRNGVLLINPGSASLPRGLSGVLGTVGIVDITDDAVKARIVPLPSPKYPLAAVRSIDLPLNT